ncbi:hypothetical protein BJ138DRAFT_1118913 [Hygrophoropsis aurantiaca]|uniref:Uncharacterized protein n=1 Tax=Hygrophoropsis aurantiaca TaxID=72124 RepID=A0ACB7ZW58_9AGAM|nr:hypothetical protein BJ138DRAFT_1118913 [Hygrophoropsis aurantiaca]
MKISTVVAEPNARGHRDDTLSWFWSMDVEGDSTSDDWMSECKGPPGLMGRGAEQWLARMAVADQQHKWGHKAYAAKQANMYRSMALKALEAFQKVKGVVVEGGDLFGAAEGPGWEDSD